jgi:DNA repair exonuclease SbcCD ATPase subunit
MEVMPELKTKFEELEKRIQKLIHLHTQLKSENQKLVGLNRKLEMELEEERQRFNNLEAGLANLKAEEKSSANKRISGMQQKINEMIGEIDRSVSLISVQNKK